MINLTKSENGEAKAKILKEKHFCHHKERGIYFNKNTKKIFSEQVIDERSLIWLENAINSNNKVGLWKFYSNDPLSCETKIEILHVLDSD